MQCSKGWLPLGRWSPEPSVPKATNSPPPPHAHTSISSTNTAWELWDKAGWSHSCNQHRPGPYDAGQYRHRMSMSPINEQMHTLHVYKDPEPLPIGAHSPQ